MENWRGQQIATFFTVKQLILAYFDVKMDFFLDFRDKMKNLKVDLKSARKISLTIREDLSILCEKCQKYEKCI